jgi:hypothetical protein
MKKVGVFASFLYSSPGVVLVIGQSCHGEPTPTSLTKHQGSSRVGCVIKYIK